MQKKRYPLSEKISISKMFWKLNLKISEMRNATYKDTIDIMSQLEK